MKNNSAYIHKENEEIPIKHPDKNGKNIKSSLQEFHSDFNNNEKTLDKKSKNDDKIDKREMSRQKKLEHETMDDLFNEVEKLNAKNILKGNLSEIYDEIIKDNIDFKENIFFINLNHYENLIGTCDKNIVSHTIKDYNKENLLKNKYLPIRELYNKYEKKAKVIKEKNEF